MMGSYINNMFCQHIIATTHNELSAIIFLIGLLLASRFFFVIILFTHEPTYLTLY